MANAIAKASLPSVMEMAAKAKINLLTAATDLEREWRELGLSIKDQDLRIKTFLLSEMAHIEEHRNPTRLNKFLSMVRGSGARVNAIHSFIQLHFNLRLNEKAETAKDQNGNFKYKREEPTGKDGKESYVWYYDMKKARKESEFKQHFAAALAKNWWEHRPEAAPTAFVFDDKVVTLLKSAFRVALKPGQGQEIKMDNSFLHDLAELAMKHGIEAKTFMPENLGDVQPPKELADLITPINDNGEGTTTNPETPGDDSANKDVIETGVVKAGRNRGQAVGNRDRKAKSEANDGIKAA